jgi:mannose-1-phosphate guanylyltransferase/mannose-6-phosphate isomerase
MEKVERPWGNYVNLRKEDSFNLKMITVNPLGQLSLQFHNHRAEHWVVVSGEAEVTVDKNISKLSSGQHVYIPVNSIHRIRNPSSLDPLVFIEVQTGTYFGEDDIVRLEDIYGRT